MTKLSLRCSAPTGRLFVLVVCERSGIVREAFNAFAGVIAYSCDTASAEDGRHDSHLQMDAFEAIKWRKWDLVIAHPPCTRLCNSGVLRLYKDGKKVNGIDPVKWAEMREGARFFRRFFTDYAGPLVVENPVMHGHAMTYVGCDDCPTQTIQPYEFGADASKRTKLWLRGVPALTFTPSQRKSGRWVIDPRSGKVVERWANQTDSGQNRLGPSETRAIDRARTYPQIAAAMAAQWVAYLTSTEDYS